MPEGTPALVSRHPGSAGESETEKAGKKRTGKSAAEKTVRQRG